MSRTTWPSARNARCCYAFAPHCRSVAQWRALLGECGFDSEAKPMSRGAAYANVLLIAHAA